MEKIDNKLDKNIAPVVMCLRENGFNTISSCDGGTSGNINHCFPFPTIRICPFEETLIWNENDISNAFEYDHHNIWLIIDRVRYILKYSKWGKSYFEVRLNFANTYSNKTDDFYLFIDVVFPHGINNEYEDKDGNISWPWWNKQLDEYYV